MRLPVLFAAASAETTISTDSLLYLGEAGDPVPDRALLQQIRVDLRWDKGGTAPLTWVLTADEAGDQPLWSGEDDATDALTDGDRASVQLALGEDGIARAGTGGRLYLWLSLAAGNAYATATLTGEQR